MIPVLKAAVTTIFFTAAVAPLGPVPMTITALAGGTATAVATKMSLVKIVSVATTALTGIAWLWAKAAPVAQMHQQPYMTPGIPLVPESPYVRCFNLCDNFKDNALAQLVCQAVCWVKYG
jgi:hypothetical protein